MLEGAVPTRRANLRQVATRDGAYVHGYEGCDFSSPSGLQARRAQGTPAHERVGLQARRAQGTPAHERVGLQARRAQGTPAHERVGLQARRAQGTPAHETPSPRQAKKASQGISEELRSTVALIEHSERSETATQKAETQRVSAVRHQTAPRLSIFRVIGVGAGLILQTLSLLTVSQTAWAQTIVIEDETQGDNILPDVTYCQGLELVNPGFGFGKQDFNTSCPDQIILRNKGLNPEAYEVTEVQFDPPEAMTSARLQALDKLTGRLTDLRVGVGETALFETIMIKASACYKNPETETPESAAFLSVVDTITGDDQAVFSGWMYASSPSLNAMDHAIYDVWVVDCTN